MTKSILSEQREADEAQLRVLEGAARGLSSEDPYNYLPRGVSAGHALWAAARIRALSEALQEACHERDGLLAKVPEWQPIETAPRDGAWVLLAREFEWSTPGWWAEDNSEGDWYELNNHPSDSWGGPLAGVSHWMPLPTPPGEK